MTVELVKSSQSYNGETFYAHSKEFLNAANISSNFSQLYLPEVQNLMRKCNQYLELTYGSMSNTNPKIQYITTLWQVERYNGFE